MKYLHSLLNHYKEIIVVTSILVVAFFLRIRNINLNFWQDEVYMVDAIKGILEYGFPMLPSGVIYDRGFPGNYISASSSLLLGSVSEFSLRLPIVIFGIGSILAVYLLLKKYTNKPVALLVALIIAISPWHIMYSFFLREYMFISIFFFAITFFIFRFIQLKSISAKHLVIFGILWAAFTIATGYSLITVSLLGPLFIVYLLKKEYRHNIFIISIAIVVMAGIDYLWIDKISGQIFQQIEHPLTDTILSQSATTRLDYYALLRKYILISPYFIQTFIQYFPLGLPLITILGGVYLYKKDIKMFFPIAVIAVLVFLTFINPIAKFQPRYLFVLSLLYFFCLGLGMFEVYKKNKYLAIILFVLCFDFYNIKNVLTLHYGTPLNKTMRVSESYPYFPDIKSPIEYVNREYKNGDIIISLQPRSQTITYLQPKLDYYLRTDNYQRESVFNGKTWIDSYRNIPVITSTQELNAIVENKPEHVTIYIISSDSENLHLNPHITQDTLEYLQKEDVNVIHTSDYRYAKVYTF